MLRSKELRRAVFAFTKTLAEPGVATEGSEDWSG